MKIQLKFLFVGIIGISLSSKGAEMNNAPVDVVTSAVVIQHTDRLNKVDDEIAGLSKELNQLVTNFTNFVSFTNTLVPIGAIMEYSGTAVVPNNWLECDGRAVSRVEYQDLLQAIGVTYGAGDQLNTFNIPDRRGYVAVGIDTNNSTGNRITAATASSIALGQTFGKETHALTVNEMPSHNHTFFRNWTGGGHGWVRCDEGDSNGGGGSAIDVSKNGGNQPHNNMQPSIFMKFYIRAH